MSLRPALIDVAKSPATLTVIGFALTVLAPMSHRQTDAMAPHPRSQIGGKSNGAIAVPLEHGTVAGRPEMPYWL